MKLLKIYLLMIILLFSINAFGQNTIRNKFFYFSCNCEEVENYYTPKNHSNNYTYISNVYEAGFMISISEFSSDKSSQKAFLNAIKNSGTFDYQNTTFLKQDAIIADTYFAADNKFLKMIGFFVGDKSFNITIFGTQKHHVNQLFNQIKTTFKTH